MASVLRRIVPAVVALFPAVTLAQTSPGGGRPDSTANPARTPIDRTSHGRPLAIAGATPQPQDPSLIGQRSGGSLLRATLSTPIDPESASLKDVSYFSVPEPEPRSIKKHDLVTIVVNEESQFKSQGTTDLKKAADLDAKIDAFVRFSLSNFALKTNTGGAGGGGAVPEIKLEGTRDFKGDATVNRSDSFSTHITAEVLDVKPNGTLVLQARQHIRTDDEEQMMIFSGVCRVEDVTPDNTVLSTQIYDKDVSKTSRGAVRDTTKRGWVPKLLDVINPF